LSQVTERLLKPFLFTVFICAAAWLSYYIDVSRLILIAVINLAICALVLGYIVIKKTKPFFSKGTERYRGEGISKQTFYFLAISLLQLLTTKIGMLIMPYFTDEKAIGVFNIAARFSDLIIYPFYLLHAVLPQLFAKHHEADLPYKQKLYTESTWIILITSLPLLLLNLAAGPWLLGYFGEAFTEGYTALVYMSISNGLFAIFGPANTILMMQGREKLSAIALLVYFILLTVLSRILIPTQGITGAALAMLFSNIVYNILLAVYANRYTGVSAPLFRLFEKRRGA
jgi:O-antigen/teichoic acid export membrane protein